MSLVLLNRRAGGGRAAALEAPLRQWLAAERPLASCAAPASLAEAQALVASRPPGSRVVVVGGDGTLHRLLPALLQRQHELALVPAGSGDDTARALGLHALPWHEALRHALDAPSTPTDLGEARTAHEQRPFISSLAAGFDAAVAQRALQGPAALTGLPRYLWATLRELAALKRHRLRIAVDGVGWYDGPALFASTLNTPSYGSGMPAVPGARMTDGRLDLLLAARFGRLGALAMLPRLLAGRHLGHAQVATVPFRSLRIVCSTPMPLAADGEALAAAAEVEVEVRPGALRVVGRRDGPRATEAEVAASAARAGP